MSPHSMLVTLFLYVALPIAALICVIAGFSGKVKTLGVTIGCTLAGAAVMFATSAQWTNAGQSLASGVLKLLGLG